MSTAPASASASDPQDPQDPKPEAAPQPKPKPRPKLVFDDPLDQQSSDDTDRGWGERPTAGGSAADLARFLDEKPPHHL
ncbi:hypothetical protein MTF65_17230 [Streptomyces sp. APSN-46.1]|uniref:hypothetical protein n=1 Tax=Streptomyces sp. APSN-46.1 TaxID=2929049 RepID=UPI001FB30C3E|nr:hypothetical protein [Streptomyces sp. APSN-46.1]MCJ1679050.1 hypothetical protein [Streptomyces sp. APSN-46.1]